MKYRVLATDYDGTIATHGVMDEEAMTGIRAWRAAGGEVWLVTGRERQELGEVCPRYPEFFDWVVGENGAVLFRPWDREEELLCPPLDPAWVEHLQKHGASRLFLGRVLASGWIDELPQIETALRTWKEPLHLVRNKQHLMVLPAGVDKASGLHALCRRRDVDPQQVAGVGDAENDLPLLQAVGLAWAVGNALPQVKAAADWVASTARGAGVAELIRRLLHEQAP